MPDYPTWFWAAILGSLPGWCDIFVRAVGFIARGGRRKWRLDVTLQTTMFTYGPDLGPRMVQVEASNPGDRSIRLVAAGIRLPNKKSLNIIAQLGDAVTFPYDLPEGRSCSVYIPYDELNLQLQSEGYTGRVKLRGFYRNDLGDEYLGPTWSFSA
jgi:hypothetical protein